MNNNLTIEAVRLSMHMHQLRAEMASRNIARAAIPGGQAARLDFARSQQLLDTVMNADDGVRADGTLLQALDKEAQVPVDAYLRQTAVDAINLDEQVADLASANLGYQGLTESLTRYLGLQRLAITGRN